MTVVEISWKLSRSRYCDIIKYTQNVFIHSFIVVCLCCWCANERTFKMDWVTTVWFQIYLLCVIAKDATKKQAALSGKLEVQYNYVGDVFISWSCEAVVIATYYYTYSCFVDGVAVELHSMCVCVCVCVSYIIAFVVLMIAFCVAQHTTFKWWHKSSFSESFNDFWIKIRAIKNKTNRFFFCSFTS